MKRIAIALILLCIYAQNSLEAQGNATKRPLWMEMGLSLSTPSLYPKAANTYANVSLGINKRVNDKFSVGVLVDGESDFELQSLACDDLGYDKRFTLSVVPNVTLECPINRFLTWTPRAFLSFGYQLKDHTQYNNLTSEDVREKAIPIAIGLKLCSFDVRISDKCAANFTIDPLNLSLGYQKNINNTFPDMIPIQLPLGRVILNSSPLMTIGFHLNL